MRISGVTGMDTHHYTAQDLEGRWMFWEKNRFAGFESNSALKVIPLK